MIDPAFQVLDIAAEVIGRYPVEISRCGEKVSVRIKLAENDYAEGWGETTREALECARQFREERDSKWQQAHEDSIRAKEQAARVDAETDRLCGPRADTMQEGIPQ